MSHYFDFASTTPVDPHILEIVIDTAKNVWANPSSIHRSGQKARAILEKSRLLVADTIRAKPTQIIFTSCATEANNLVLQGVLKKTLEKTIHPPHMLIGAIEHASVYNIYKMHGESAFSEVYPVQQNGTYIVSDILSRITDSTVLISMMYVSNELGAIQPVSEAVKALQEINAARKLQNLPQIFLHCDAVQAGLYLPLDVQELGVDFLTLSSHKLYAPRGVGMVYVKNENIAPLFFGGGQEFGMRSGTENVAGIVGFSHALEQAQRSCEASKNHVKNLEAVFLEELLCVLPNVMVNTDTEHSAGHIVSITLPHIKQDELLILLDSKGFEVSGGSSCASGAVEKSHVLEAMGQYNGADIRISFGKHTTVQQCKDLVQAIHESVEKLTHQTA
jgi:cysteine desulfurase